MPIQPYLNLAGRCDEAVEFYGKALGAKVEMLMRMKDAPPEMRPPGLDGKALDQVMHMCLRIGDAALLASDGCAGADAQPKFEGISLSLSVASPEEARRTYDALLDGGQQTMPLAPTFFSTSFGMLTDRFGVAWMIVAPPPPSFAPGRAQREPAAV